MSIRWRWKGWVIAPEFQSMRRAAIITIRSRKRSRSWRAGWLRKQSSAAWTNRNSKCSSTPPRSWKKPLGEAAGIGWQGKHSNLVSREHGSWLFLGAIYTTVPFPPDDAHEDRCGSCNDCQVACPTDAFPQPYVVDARRCISYLTIEHKGPIPEEFREAMGNRIYGCDDCLAVCPWNKFAETAARHMALAPRVELAAPRLADFLQLDDAAFRTLFSGSPIKRIGRDSFVRNCLIAAGNSDERELLGQVERLTSDPDPVVAEAAVWALGKLRATP